MPKAFYLHFYDITKESDETERQKCDGRGRKSHNKYIYNTNTVSIPTHSFIQYNQQFSLLLLYYYIAQRKKKSQRSTYSHTQHVIIII